MSEKYFYLKGLPAKDIGVPGTRAELEALGARFKLSREPVRLADNIMTTGEVPVSVDYEQIDSTLHVKEEENYLPDQLADDLSLIIKTEKGLIILLGCGHRGLINTILHAQKITGVQQIYAVIGGTHLISANKTQLDETVKALRNFNISRLGVSHCTGLKSGAILANEFSEAFFFNSAGTKTCTVISLTKTAAFPLLSLATTFPRRAYGKVRCRASVWLPSLQQRQTVRPLPGCRPC